MRIQRRFAHLGLAVGLGLALVALLFAPAWAQGGQGDKTPTPAPEDKGGAGAEANAPSGGFVDLSRSTFTARHTHGGAWALYQVVISNTGDTTATGTELIVNLPNNGVLDSNSPYVVGGGTLGQAGDSLTWTGDVTGGQAITLAYSVQLPTTVGEWVESTAVIWNSQEAAAHHRRARLQVQATSGGPDHFGYTFKDSYAGGGPSYTWVPTTTPASKLNFGGVQVDDAVTGPVPLGFTFRFYTGTYTQTYVSTNGLVLFGAGSADNRPGPIPLLDQSNNYAACLGADLYVKDASQGIWVETSGPAGSKIAVITFRMAYFVTNGQADVPPALFQMILSEVSNTIKCQYAETPGPTFASGTSGLVGLENGAGTAGLTYFYDPAGQSNFDIRDILVGPLEPNLAVEFTPGGANLPLLTTSSLRASHNVHPGGQVTYTVVVHNTGNAAAGAATVNNPIPAGTTYVNGSAAVQGGGVVNGSPAGVTWAGSVGVGAKVTITYRLNLPTTVGTTITNTATVNASTAPAPVVLVNNRVTVLPPPTGGPDEYGYTYEDTHNPGAGISFQWVPTSALASKLNFVSLPADDVVTGPITLPYTFIFYGRPYTQVHISTNGLVLFGAPTNSNEVAPIPTPGGAADNYAACFNGDLILQDASHGIWIETVDSPPNRKTVITYRMPYWNDSAGPAAVFQMVLFETYNVINCYYLDMPDTDALSGGMGATIGVEGHDGTAGLQYFHDPAGGPDRYGPLESGLAIALRDGLDNQAGFSASSKTATNGMHPGQRVTYTLVGVNHSLFNAPDSFIYDAIPAGTTYVPGSAAVQGGGVVNGTSSDVQWNGGLAAGQRVTVTLAVSLPQAGQVVNAAIFDSANALPAYRSVTTPIQPPAGLGTGPIRYGYRDSYAPGVSYTWVPTTGASTKMITTTGDNDDGLGFVPLGFTFEFYGRSYSAAQVSTNGLVMFNGVGSIENVSQSIPRTGSADNYAACYWDDLVVQDSSQGIWYETQGSPPNRTAVITWRVGSFAQPSQPVRVFQMILHETSGLIKCQYQSIGSGPDGFEGDGRTATVGVENEWGTGGTQYFSKRAQPPLIGPLEPGLAIEFRPMWALNLPLVTK